MWWKESDITLTKTELISVNNITGYVLPHAGTSHSGEVISHTLRFKPNKMFKKILILFYPANPSENVITIKPPMSRIRSWRAIS